MHLSTHDTTVSGVLLVISLLAHHRSSEQESSEPRRHHQARCYMQKQAILLDPSQHKPHSPAVLTTRWNGSIKKMRREADHHPSIVPHPPPHPTQWVVNESQHANPPLKHGTYTNIRPLTAFPPLLQSNTRHLQKELDLSEASPDFMNVQIYICTNLYCYKRVVVVLVCRMYY